MLYMNNVSKKKQRAIVAMSGGVDSSVVAAMLHAEGYEVVGITLQLYNHQGTVTNKTCCAGQDIQDAKNVAAHIGFRHYTLDYESRFKEAVIEEFADSYLRGETPIPCVRCNQSVKFVDLLKTAQELNGDFLATGHYVQRLQGQKTELHQGIDQTKDQSYFLFATTQQQLDYLRFPLGNQSKTETRKLAESYGLPVAEKPDSQDICFVPNGKYSDIVRKLRPESDNPGDIVDMQGNIMGRHTGIINFTIGQRRGIGIGGTAEALYVIGLNAKKNQVIVGEQAALAKIAIQLKDVNWLGDNNLVAQQSVAVKIRSTRPPVPAKLYATEDNKAAVVFDAPQYGVAAGQAAVFYDDSRVLGGGWIC